MPPITVAIVGSGIGAASACYFLNKRFHGNVVIGGRTESTTINGSSMELGAGIAYSGNKYMSGWVDEFGLEKRKPPEDIFGLWNGKQFVFQKSKSSNVTAAKLFARYGSDLLVLRSAVYELLAKFDDIYPAQEIGRCFETPADLWGSVGLRYATQTRFDDIMATKLSPNSLLQKELMFAINRVNYNQNKSLNYLAGTVSMCPLVTGDVFSVTTGWNSVHQAIFKHSGVRHLYLSHPVTRVISMEDDSSSSTLTNDKTTPDQKRKKYSVEVGDRNMGSYDAVILTAPLSSTEPIQLQLDGQNLDTSRYIRDFKVTHTTFVKGRMNRDYFPPLSSHNPTKPALPLLDSLLHLSLGSYYVDPSISPTTVLLTDEGAAKEKFSSYSRYFDYDGGSSGNASNKQTEGHSLFKVFSTEPLDISTLGNLFTPDSSVVTTKKWFAYPLFSPPEDVSVPFRMKENHSVFNTSVLEFSVSAMEVSAIGGRNVAMLVHQDLCDKGCFKKFC